jgi:MYXO-CTERM domain-containing protein
MTQHPKLTAACAAAAVTTLATTAGAATLPFSEDFNDNVADGFSASSGWTATNQEYQVDISGSGSTRFSGVELTNVGSNPIVISSDFTMSELDGNVGFLSFGGPAATTPFYLTDFDGSGGLRIFDSGTGTFLATTTTLPNQSFSFGTTYTLEATFTPIGSDLQINVDLLDGSTLISTATALDPTPLSGQVFGYRGRTTTSSTANAIIGAGDNFSVTVVPEPSAALAAIGGLGLLASRRRRD